MVFYIFYYVLVGTAFMISLLLIYRGNQKIWPLSLLLCITLTEEIVAHYFIYLKIDFSWIYQLYTPIEYTLLTLYLSFEISRPWLRKAVRLSVAVFVPLSLSISYFLYNFKSLPGLNIQIESVLIFAITTYCLFNLESRDDDRPIFLNGHFWICTGLLLFFSVSIFVFGIYTPLFNLSTSAATRLFGLIVHPMNIVLYAAIITGLLCLIPRTKSSRR